MGAVLQGGRDAEIEKSDVTLAFGDDKSEIRNRSGLILERQTCKRERNMNLYNTHSLLTLQSS